MLIKRMYKLAMDWLQVPKGDPKYEELIHELVKINAENLFFFGTVSANPWVFIRNNRLGNLPAEGGFFGAGEMRPWLPDIWYIK